MAEKTGAGGKPQEYDTKTGWYSNLPSADSIVRNYEKRFGEIKSSEVTSRTTWVKTAPFHFRNKLIEAKESNSPETRWRVDIHESTDYVGDALFLTAGGSCVAIEPDGNIISVCKNQFDTQTRGQDLLRKAISEGGDRLDAFGKGLYDFYTKNGFQPVSWTPFNRAYAPDGWKEEYGDEPVIFYKYTGNKSTLSYYEFLSKTKQSSDYDEAKDIRDKEIRG